MKVYKLKIKWYWGMVHGFIHIIDGLLLILTLGNYSTDLLLIWSLWAATKNKRKQTPTPT